jgi:hypothetical protein
LVRSEKDKNLHSSVSIIVDPKESVVKVKRKESRRASTDREGVSRGFHAVFSIRTGKTRRILSDSFAWTRHAGKFSRAFTHPWGFAELSQ